MTPTPTLIRTLLDKICAFECVNRKCMKPLTKIFKHPVIVYLLWTIKHFYFRDPFRDQWGSPDPTLRTKGWHNTLTHINKSSPGWARVSQLCRQTITLRKWENWSCSCPRPVGILTYTSTRWEWATAGQERWPRTGMRCRRPAPFGGCTQRWGPETRAPPWTGRRTWRTCSRSRTQLVCTSDSCCRRLDSRPDQSARPCVTSSQARAFWAGAPRSAPCCPGACEPDTPAPESGGDTRGSRFSILDPPRSAGRRGTPGRRCESSPAVWECGCPGRSSCSRFYTRIRRWETSPWRQAEQSHGPLPHRSPPPPPCSVWTGCRNCVILHWWSNSQSALRDVTRGEKNTRLVIKVRPTLPLPAFPGMIQYR